MNTPLTLANVLACAATVGALALVVGVWTLIMVLVADHGCSSG